MPEDIAGSLTGKSIDAALTSMKDMMTPDAVLVDVEAAMEALGEITGQTMREEIKGTILIISHQERILDIADKIVVLKAGEIDAIGTKEEILPNILAASASCSKLEGGRN